MMKDLVLASASPRRQELLRLITENFTVHVADVDETLSVGMPIAQQIEALAERKAAAVLACHQGAVVIGADTMVVIDGTPLGKPKDKADARRMLTMLSGRAHEVITAIAVMTEHESRFAHRVTRVNFRALSAAEIDGYVATGEPLDKAGAYGIQGKGATLITGIEGDYFNVVGLPVELLYCTLSEMGYL